jgi:hypothetical protein
MKRLNIDSKKIAIGAVTEKYYTVKSFEEDDLKRWDDDDYYNDKAKNNKYDFVDFMIEK